MPTQITSAARFKTLDATIKKSLREAGQALEEIRDKELYKAGGHKDFKSYCESIGKNYHWGWRQIEAGKIAKVMPEIKTESAAREVRKIAIPKRRQIVSAVSEKSGGKVTASAVKKAAQVTQRTKLLPKDGTGIDIPPEIQEFWNRNDEAQHLLSLVSKVKTTLEKAKEDGDLLFKFVDLQGSISRLMAVYEELQCAKSFAVCPKCNGVFFSDCTDCKKRGSLPRFWWDRQPEEIKKLRE